MKLGLISDQAIREKTKDNIQKHWKFSRKIKKSCQYFSNASTGIFYCGFHQKRHFKSSNLSSWSQEKKYSCTKDYRKINIGLK